MTRAAKNPVSGTERRRSRRRPIMETFSVFVVVPKMGISRLPIYDVSETGLAFDIDDQFPEFGVKNGDQLDILLYLNPTLNLPLEIQVVRSAESGTVRRIGGEFSEKLSKSYRAYCVFLQLLDHLVEVAESTPGR